MSERNSNPYYRTIRDAALPNLGTLQTRTQYWLWEPKPLSRSFLQPVLLYPTLLGAIIFANCESAPYQISCV